MKRKQRRMWLLISALAGLGAVAALVLVALEDNIVFFYGPSEIVAKAPATGQRLRIGGLVAIDSVKKAEDGSVSFAVTDGNNTVPVLFRGLLPDLFREGQGVVAEGALDGGGLFLASEVLAKHDEKYMPPEVAEALREQGQWKGEGR